MLEGAAKGGVPAGRDGHLRTVHARGTATTRSSRRRAAAERGDLVTVVTADRMLQSRVRRRRAPRSMSPSWLLDLL